MEGIWDELTPSDFWKQGARVTVYPHSEVRTINSNAASKHADTLLAFMGSYTYWCEAN